MEPDCHGGHQGWIAAYWPSKEHTLKRCHQQALHILAHITLGIVGEMQEWRSNDGQDIKQEQGKEQTPALRKSKKEKNKVKNKNGEEKEQEQEQGEKLPKLDLGPPPPLPEAVRTGAATPKERLPGAWVQRARLAPGGAVPKVFRVLSQSALL